MVTLAPVGAERGVAPAITGITRKDAALLAVPSEVTMASTKPGRRLAGAGATILVSDHEVGVVLTPPMVTELPVAEAPNPLPLIVKGEPIGLTGPTVGERLLICGDAQELTLRNANKTIETIVERNLTDKVVYHFHTKLPSLPISFGQLIYQQ
jgi:hypothetical protein